MKNFNIKYLQYLFTMCLVLFVGQSCNKDWLEPKALSFYSPENTLQDESGFNAALASIAKNVRQEFYEDGAPIITENIFSEMAVEGTTDKFGPAVNMDILITPDAQLNSNDFNRIGYFWERNYLIIRLSNTITSRIATVKTITDDKKNSILGRAYFFRAYAYYRLVHQFGDVPTTFSELSSAKLDFTSVKREVILQRLKTDLDFAMLHVPWVSNKGEVNRAAVGHLLTKVNLALGLFDDAIASSSAVINNGTYKLMTSRFGVDAGITSKNVIWDLHRRNNKFSAANTEVLFSVIDRFGDPSATVNGTTSMRQALPFSSSGIILTPDGLVGMTNSKVEFDHMTDYGRGIGRCRATPYATVYIWDDKKDLRHDTLSRNWMEMTMLTYNNAGTLKGKSPYYGQRLRFRKADGSLLVSGGDTIRTWFGWPHYKLYVEDEIRYPYQGGNSDWYVFRLAETYLLRAEAYWYKNDLASAAADVNMVRTRAKCSPYTAAQVDLGTILDERGRELYYEEPRKTELTRVAFILAKSGKSFAGKSYTTGNFSTANFWYDRLMAKNDFYGKGIKNVRGDLYKISPYHVLWPIPRPAILANSLGQINQNLGYAGSETNKPALDKIQE
ncbi:MAG: RagB/SusD family nutrient uptake outer membrane protein [Chitinophagaceae bacterium]|nr:RagB/SusD family nutrient uptake outer membrane protein [Chitinophagaceae bacterium]